jgi:hypothetical protein
LRPAGLKKSMSENTRQFLPDVWKLLWWSLRYSEVCNNLTTSAARHTRELELDLKEKAKGEGLFNLAL